MRLWLILFPVLMACEASGVGDPCIQERIPAGGYDANESYFEISSVQCMTRLCLVHELTGDPTKIHGTESCPSGDPTCVTQQEVDQGSYCSCRCDAPANVQTPRCECPEGFACEPLNEVGGVGVRGSYCVRVRD